MLLLRSATLIKMGVGASGSTPEGSVQRVAYEDQLPRIEGFRSIERLNKATAIEQLGEKWQLPC